MERELSPMSEARELATRDRGPGEQRGLDQTTTSMSSLLADTDTACSNDTGNESGARLAVRLHPVQRQRRGERPESGGEEKTSIFATDNRFAAMHPHRLTLRRPLTLFCQLPASSISTCRFTSVNDSRRILEDQHKA